MPLRATVTWINASAQDYRVKSQSFDNPFINETLTLSEVVGVAFSRPEGDNFAFTDVTLFNTSKNIIGDSVGFTDNVVTSTQYQRFITDGITLNDVVNSINTGVNQPNNIGISELLGYHFNKLETDNFTFLDSIENVINKIETDNNISFTDTQSIQANVITTDGFGFSDTDTRLINKVESDNNISFSETQLFTYNYFFTDGFVLDDTLQIDKDVISFKENVFSFNDTISISRTHGRALGNMVLGSSQFN